MIINSNQLTIKNITLAALAIPTIFLADCANAASLSFTVEAQANSSSGSGTGLDTG